ncbi:MAG TPA: PqqD family protein [Thermoanaerobaculia bacterium]|nr:PqqD family protein [Thermoanaerobaculia bacterium]
MLSEADVARLAEVLRSSRFSRARLTDGTGVMTDAASMRMLSLNETGMFLVEELVAGLGAEALVDRLVTEFSVSASDAHRDLEKFLVELDGFVNS